MEHIYVFVNTVCYCSVLLYIHHLSLGYWKHKNLKALKTQRTISHPGNYIFLGMILCREQFVPSENKVLALRRGNRGWGWEMVPASLWAK